MVWQTDVKKLPDIQFFGHQIVILLPEHRFPAGERTISTPGEAIPDCRSFYFEFKVNSVEIEEKTKEKTESK